MAAKLFEATVAAKKLVGAEYRKEIGCHLIEDTSIVRKDFHGILPVLKSAEEDHSQECVHL